MKHVLFLGATGTAGTVIVKDLLEKTDHIITAFARHASKIYQENDRLKVTDGDALVQAELTAAVQGQDGSTAPYQEITFRRSQKTLSLL